MIGQTNSQGGRRKGELVNVVLIDYQGSYETLKGVTIFAEIEGISTQYTWEGSGVSVLVPVGVECSISVSDVEGFVTPSPVSILAIEGNSRTLTFTYNPEVVVADIATKANQDGEGNQIASTYATKKELSGKVSSDGVLLGIQVVESVPDSPEEGVMYVVLKE